MNTLRLAMFSAIVNAGSISKAATTLGMDKSVLSRQLAKLEDELGARLIQRSTRRLTLTEIGELVFAEARSIDRAVSNIEQLTEQHQSEVQGRLRVTCPRPLGQRYLVPLLVEFTALHPKIEIALTVDDHMVDLIAEHIDVALRVAHLEDSTLVARKLGDNPRVLVASPSYLTRRGAPHSPTDLLTHDCLLYSSGARVFDEWHFTKDDISTPVRVTSKIQINDGMALAAAAVAGGGVTLLDRLLVAHELADGSLVQLLPDYQLRHGQPVYAVYPARPWLALKTATFVTFLQERLFI
ncbi:LysR family transcriptional regulator [Undibacterium jejuense]|uniref:LysR family transcriptional regulator n=1 Tax=Undibacterium jejuense TaxID=1344949 RepID=A0A923HIW1_9BURK|nr:LysR family transcriptional regulator [Undibacterium jejuense]MBC3863238.1 LysR family transcriptional regulator [Undibacterium jejuense]